MNVKVELQLQELIKLLNYEYTDEELNKKLGIGKRRIKK